MTYHAHTATDAQGNPLPENSGPWQPLAVHLRNVANLAKGFAASLDLEREAELAGQCSEDLITLLDRFKADGLQLPPFAPRPVPRTAMACSRPAGPTTLDNDQSNETLSHPT